MSTTQFLPGFLLFSLGFTFPLFSSDLDPQLSLSSFFSRSHLHSYLELTFFFISRSRSNLPSSPSSAPSHHLISSPIFSLSPHLSKPSSSPPLLLSSSPPLLCLSSISFSHCPPRTFTSRDYVCACPSPFLTEPSFLVSSIMS